MAEGLPNYTTGDILPSNFANDFVQSTGVRKDIPDSFTSTASHLVDLMRDYNTLPSAEIDLIPTYSETQSIADILRPVLAEPLRGPTPISIDVFRTPSLPQAEKVVPIPIRQFA